MLKTPTTLDALLEEWSIDATIDDTELGRATQNIPTLHAKYLKVLSHHNLLSKKYFWEYEKMKRIKSEYYNGDLNNVDDLAKYGLPPMIKRIGKPDVQLHMNSDDDLIAILQKKAVHDEIVESARAIMKEINNRTWQTKNMLDYEKFIGGK